jgi:hypothetical protein
MPGSREGEEFAEEQKPPIALFLCLQIHDSADSSESVSKDHQTAEAWCAWMSRSHPKASELAIAADMLKRRLKQAAGRSSAGCVQASIFAPSGGAWRTIAGYEAIHMIRKGQACCRPAGAKVGLVYRFILGLFAATS